MTFTDSPLEPPHPLYRNPSVTMRSKTLPLYTPMRRYNMLRKVEWSRNNSLIETTSLLNHEPTNKIKRHSSELPKGGSKFCQQSYAVIIIESALSVNNFFF